MTWLAPLGAAALLAVPAILLLYFLKVKRPETRVASLLFWRPFVADRQANAPWQRLRSSWLLVLQLLAALAIALALLRPGVTGAAGIADTTIVILDGSASMQATDVGPTRFGAAVDQARGLVSQLPARGVDGRPRSGAADCRRSRPRGRPLACERRPHRAPERIHPAARRRPRPGAGGATQAAGPAHLRAGRQHR
ncbi:MAG: VWA domain-containing protein [Chloroflexi bacterium]|nr:MAG: VWA domain-containing protein [Chloroflexota bacterium]